ncbi:MAG: GreA/GreB family elongation factor [Bacteroidia bacterium]|nr:GreA/GreB family elongation factor [Bacteroidia bacterium]
MKPIISETVYKKLFELLHKANNPEGKQLGIELSNAQIVKDTEFNQDIVTINSTVEVLDDTRNKPIRLKIVMPEEADLSQKKISVFAPISVALLGFRESYAFNWMLPSGNKKLKILKVLN